MKKFALIGKIVGFLLYMLVVVLGISIAMVWLFGWKLYSIQTGSMEPSYPVGMMIFVEPVGFDQLESGDVVTFVKSDNTVVTHRIVDIDRETHMITTKGDNNNAPDGSPVSYKNVIGRVKFGVPKVGYFVLVLNTTFGKWMIGLTLVLLLGIEAIRRMYYHDRYVEALDENMGDEHSNEQEN